MSVVLDSNDQVSTSTVLIRDEHPSDSATYYSAFGQSFQTPATPQYFLDSVVFELTKSGLPTSDLVARLYAHSGTYGTSSKPTGNSLASSNALSASTLTDVKTQKTLAFSGANRILLTASTKYCIVLEAATANVDNINYVSIGRTAGGHAGNQCGYLNGAWISAAAADLVFIVYGVSAVSTTPPSLGATTRRQRKPRRKRLPLNLLLAVKDYLEMKLADD